MNKYILKSKEVLTSEEWQKLHPTIVIVDPDGWDRNNFCHSFKEEKITIEEYKKRMENSTVIRKTK